MVQSPRIFAPLPNIRIKYMGLMQKLRDACSFQLWRTSEMSHDAESDEAVELADCMNLVDRYGRGAGE